MTLLDPTLPATGEDTAAASSKKLPIAELAARSSVDNMEEINKYFLSTIAMASRGVAWIMAGLLPEEGFLSSNYGEAKPTEDEWLSWSYRSGSVLHVIGRTFGHGGLNPRSGSKLDFNTSSAFLSKELYDSARHDALRSIAGVKIVKVPKKDDQLHITLDLFRHWSKGLGWTINYFAHSVAEVRKLPPSITDEEIKKNLATNRKAANEQADQILKHMFGGKAKLPVAPGASAEYRVTLSDMTKKEASPSGSQDKANAARIVPEQMQGYSRISKMVDITFNVVIINLVDKDAETDDDMSRFRISIEPTIALPAEFAYYVTDSEADTFNRALMFLYLGEALKAQYTAMAPKKTRKKKDDDGTQGNTVEWPIVMVDPATTVRKVNEAAAKRGKGGQPRVNQRGWSLTNEGLPYYFPTRYDGTLLVNYTKTIGSLLTRLENAKDQEERNEILTEMGKATSTMGKRTAIVDWAHDRMMQVSANGNLVAIPLQGWRALTPVHEMRLLETKLTQEDARLLQPLMAAYDILNNRLESAYQTAYRAATDSDGGYRSVTTAEDEKLRTEHARPLGQRLTSRDRFTALFKEFVGGSL